MITYDGTNFLGWQKTKMGPSIEGTLETVLEKILQHPVVLQAASRTDAGVHANGQVVNFLSDKSDLSPEKLKFSLNCLLPKDIVVLSTEHVPNDFHPTLDCINKEYHYSLCHGRIQLPNRRLYSWHYPHTLNIEDMREAIQQLIGERDFTSFCNVRKDVTYADHMRNLQSIEIVEEAGDYLCFKLTGTNFLYKMVRNLVGTLVYISCGKISVGNLRSIIDGRDRTLAGITAPAHGLFLHNVQFRATPFG